MAEADDEKDQVIQELLDRVETTESKNMQLNTAMSSSGAISNDANLVQYQLEVGEMLEKLKNYYSGTTREGYDEKGDLVWLPQTNEDLIPLNEYGVSCMMETVTKYIDKNTALSCYSEKRIYEILADLGDELVLFNLCNYEKMGMDTYTKKTKFRILITTTLHVIESAYRKAIRGSTMEILNQSKIVTQTDFIGNRGMPNQPSKKGFNLIPKFLR